MTATVDPLMTAGAAPAAVGASPPRVDRDQLLLEDQIAAAMPFDPVAFSRTFAHRKAMLDGSALHYVIGGNGPAVLLLHGWPGTWSYWRRTMVDLARDFTVISVDMPGFGHSAPLPSARKTIVADQLNRLSDALGFQKVSLVSHDMGGTVAYAYAATFPESVDKVVFTETAIPGFGFADGGGNDLLKLTPQSAAGIWHFSFFMKPGLAEMLVPGHEAELIRAMVTDNYTNPSAFGDDEAEELTRWISSPHGLSGGLAYYRTLFEDAEDNRRLAAQKLTMPVLVVNGGDGFLQYPGPSSIRAIASDVSEAVVPHSGHFLASERPGYFAHVVSDFLKGGPR